MKFSELIERANRLEPQAIDAHLRSLAGDERFLAVLALLERRKTAFARSVAAPAKARDPGALAHVAGGLFESLNVLDTLKEIIEPSPKRGAQPPDEG